MTDDKPIHHPRPWELDLSEANEWAIRTLMENARTPEQIEATLQVGSFIRMGWSDTLMKWRKTMWQRNQRLMAKAQKKKATRHGQGK